MNVALTMVDVLTTASTPRALSHAAAEMGSHWQQMEWTVMVCWHNHYSLKKGRVLINWNFLQQISMSATATMVAVHKPAPTQMVHSSAAVDLGLDWTVMEWLAVVSTHACSCVMSKGHACIDMHQCTSLPPSLPPFSHQPMCRWGPQLFSALH